MYIEGATDAMRGMMSLDVAHREGPEGLLWISQFDLQDMSLDMSLDMVRPDILEKRRPDGAPRDRLETSYPDVARRGNPEMCLIIAHLEHMETTTTSTLASFLSNQQSDIQANHVL